MVNTTIQFTFNPSLDKYLRQLSEVAAINSREWRNEDLILVINEDENIILWSDIYGYLNLFDELNLQTLSFHIRFHKSLIKICLA